MAQNHIYAGDLRLNIPSQDFYSNDDVLSFGDSDSDLAVNTFVELQQQKNEKVSAFKCFKDRTYDRPASSFIVKNCQGILLYKYNSISTRHTHRSTDLQCLTVSHIFCHTCFFSHKMFTDLLKIGKNVEKNSIQVSVIAFCENNKNSGAILPEMYVCK